MGFDDLHKKRQGNLRKRKAENEDMNVAWSNEAIELWFLLHFEFISTGISREQYIDKLNVYFKKNNINNGKYGKNLSNIYEILETCGNYNSAVKFAKRLEEQHKIDTPANNKPMTKVYKLVEELKKILNRNKKNDFIRYLWSRFFTTKEIIN